MWSIVNFARNQLSFVLCKRSAAMDNLLVTIVVFTEENGLFSKANILHDLNYYS